MPLFPSPAHPIDAYKHLLIPGSNALSEVESNGVIFSIDKAMEVREKEIAPILEAQEKIAKEVIGDEINLNSNQQVARFLYDVSGIPDPHLKHKSRSVDVEHLKVIKGYDWLDEDLRKFVNALGEYRRVEKLRGTYIDGTIKLLDFDGRLRCSFNLIGTATGRLSASKPNLQNQPRGPLIRQCYIAGPGEVLLQADYSQCELRVAAMLSNDENLKTIYREGRDLHSEMAASFYGKNFKKEQRSKAKNMNFGITYGQSAFAFSQMYEIPQKEAQQYINNWWKMFPQLSNWRTLIVDDIRKLGRVALATGRYRRFPLITDDNKDAIFRAGINCAIQGVASDITLWALIELVKKEGKDFITLLTVHDSILLAVKEDKIESVKALVQSTMEVAAEKMFGWTDIPFVADLQIGLDWGHVE